LKRLDEDLHHERTLALDNQEMLRRSKIKEQELEEQLESLLRELEESEDNYDDLMDSFAQSQRTVERMRSELNVGAQLVQKLQDEKVQLLEEIKELEKENAEAAQSEELLQTVRQLSILLMGGLISGKTMT
jgi:myosin heavy chain 9/10/11/14